MEKLKLHSPDFTQENIAKLAALFPNCVTEGQAEDGTLKRSIDFDQLQQELSDHVVDGPRERFHLTWPGKKDALLAANAPIAKTLRPDRDESLNFDATKNLFIEGDNLDALKLLQESLLAKVKMIYIDPPYNIGNDYVYSDDFVETSGEYLQRSNQEDERGNRLILNSEANVRFHSQWLTMIYSRLRLARNLLRNDGVILFSIDDTEYANLRKVCDEVFGEGNFIATLAWEKGRKCDARRFSVGHDYILIYARDLTVVEEVAAPWREPKEGVDAIIERYHELKSNCGADYDAISEGLVSFYRSLPKEHPAKKYARSRFVDGRGIWRDNNISWPGGGGPRYALPHPQTGEPCKIPDDGWRFVETTMREKIASGYVQFREDHTTSPFLKSYLYVDPDAQDTSTVDESGVKQQVMGSVFYRHTQPSNDVMKRLFGDKVFNNPKDHLILMRLIRYCTRPDDIVMDFFAGSGSFAHACMEANRQDKGQRRFVVVQLPEELDENNKDHRSAIQFCDKNRVPRNIAEICKERIRRAGSEFKSKKVASWAPDLGFRVLKVDSSNMKDVYYKPDALKKDDLFGHIENIKEDRTPEDLLFQVLLDWGVDLSLPIAQEEIDSKTVFFVDENALAACFDTGVTEELVKKIAARKPLRAVFRDAGFSDDSVKINVEQIFKLMSPGTEVKAI